jgi:hypothetical protein
MEVFYYEPSKKLLFPCDHPKFQKLMCTIKKLFCALYTTPSTFTYKTITVSAVRWDHVAKDPPPNVLFSMEKAMRLPTAGDGISPAIRFPWTDAVKRPAAGTWEWNAKKPEPSRSSNTSVVRQNKVHGKAHPVLLPRAPPTTNSYPPRSPPAGASVRRRHHRGCPARLRRPGANRSGPPLRSSLATVDATAADPGTGRIWARAPPQPTGLPGGDGAALSGPVSAAEEKCGILEQPASPSAVKGLYGGGEKEEPRSSGRSSRKVGREGCPLGKRRRQHSPETSSEESSTARSRYFHSPAM